MSRAERSEVTRRASPAKILVIDDEPAFLRLVRTVVTLEGYQFVAATEAQVGLALAQRERPAVILVDCLLPDDSDMTLIPRLRERFYAPLILCSALDRDRLQPCLIRLTDDYLSKPFQPEELVAAIRCLAEDPPAERVAQLTQRIHTPIDLNAHHAAYGERKPRLSRTEWRLLDELAAHPGDVLSEDELIRGLWEQPVRNDRDLLGVFIGRLRRTLCLAGEDISLERVTGVGYRLLVAHKV